MSISTVAAVVVPLILLLAGAFAKKLIRASSFEWRDWYLGVEFTLAAMSSGLIYVSDLVRELAPSKLSNVQGKPTATALFVAVTFLALLAVLTLHQDWEGAADSIAKRVRLFGIANFIGAGLLVVFILLVKGVS